MLLALYDLRSKQEYIYRTNRIREISGASFLLANIFDEFIEKAAEGGISVRGITEAPFSLSVFENSDSDAEVIYNGGGNLMMLYKDNDAYVRANKVFSRLLFDLTYTVSAVVSKTEFTGNFKKDRDAVYRANALKKNTEAVSYPCSVLPFTQVDMQTYMPIVEKRRENGEKQSLSQESVCKLDAIKKEPKNKLYAKNLDDLVADKGRESLLAIIYIDGNNMGAKLMQALGDEHGYDWCINALRRFSEKTNRDFVDAPISAIEKMLTEKQAAGVKYTKYRKVIAGGDEITLICNARMVPEILDIYFKTLDSENSGNYACAGVAIFHSHAPYADVYEIAEQCCESGKKCSRGYGSNANFIDFHFCRAGITNDMEIVREKQEKELTARPYRIDGEHEGYSYGELIHLANELNGTCKSDNDPSETKGIGRANIKELATAVIKGESYYRFEVERINSRFENIHIDPKDEKTRKMIFDIAQVYDLWFAGEGEVEK